MAQFRATKSGINAEVQKKLEDGYDEDLEQECIEWMESVTNEPFPVADEDDVRAIGKKFKGINFHISLKDGTYLLKLIKALDSTAKVRIPSKPPQGPFKQRDLIQHFITACVAYGVPKESMFETEDLHSAVNMNMVVCSLVALGSAAQRNGYDGMPFGPKLANKNKREFDEEVLQEGNMVIGLQMGSNMGASQSGMTPYGQGRQIYDPKIIDQPKYEYVDEDGQPDQFYENDGQLYTNESPQEHIYANDDDQPNQFYENEGPPDQFYENEGPPDQLYENEGPPDQIYENEQLEQIYENDDQYRKEDDSNNLYEIMER